MGLFAIIAFLLFHWSSSDAANILFLYFPSFSHIRGALHVATELGSRGHVVWNALPSRLADDERLQVPGVKNLPYHSFDNYDLDENLVDQQIEGFLKNGHIPLYSLLETCKQVTDRILRDAELFTDIQKLKFDLVVIDTAPMARMLTIIPYRLDIPYMYIGATFQPYASRTPFVMSTFPFPIMPWAPEMDFRSRLVSTVMVSMFWLYDPFSFYSSVAIYAPEKPFVRLEALPPRAVLWLIDLEPFLHYPQATLPNVKFIGSLSSSQLRPIPEPYLKFMDEAKDGVIIVSFGSKVKHLPNEIFQKFLDAFSQTKYRYIFKTDKRPNVNTNIMLTDWMPQSDLLAHTNVKLFITHCGANGQNEAFLRGVPMLGFPMFAEQHFNAEKIVYKGFGLRLDLNHFTVNELVDRIQELVTNSSFSMKIKKAAEITKLRERTPKEEAVYWIEHVLQYDGDHLRSYCQDMPLYQYLNLDVIGLLMLLFYLIAFFIWKLCCFCIRKTCGQPKQKVD